ncbi:MFS transporter, partial [Kibdelosporangium lantanae]
AAMGMWAAVAGVATMAGPVAGGLLVQTAGWEWIFFVNVPIGVTALVLVFALVPNWVPGHSHRFDVPGIVLSSLGLLALVFGLQNGQQYHWGEVVWGITITEIIAAGVVLLVAFVVWQAHNRNEPLLPLNLFANRTFSFGNLTNLSIGFAMTAMFVPFVIFMQTVRGFGYRFPAFLVGRGTASLRQSVLESPAVTSVELRQEAATGDPWPPYATNVREASYRITDEDVRQLVDNGHSEDEIFEVTVAAAVGASLSAYEAPNSAG